MTIWEDNNACIQMGHELRGSKSAKHFEVRLRFLNEQIHDRAIEFARIDTTNQLADGLTKPLAIPHGGTGRDSTSWGAGCVERREKRKEERE